MINAGRDAPQKFSGHSRSAGASCGRRLLRVGERRRRKQPWHVHRQRWQPFAFAGSGGVDRRRFEGERCDVLIITPGPTSRRTAARRCRRLPATSGGVARSANDDWLAPGCSAVDDVSSPASRCRRGQQRAERRAPAARSAERRRSAFRLALWPRRTGAHGSHVLCCSALLRARLVWLLFGVTTRAAATSWPSSAPPTGSTVTSPPLPAGVELGRCSNPVADDCCSWWRCSASPSTQRAGGDRRPPCWREAAVSVATSCWRRWVQSHRRHWWGKADLLLLFAFPLFSSATRCRLARTARGARLAERAAGFGLGYIGPPATSRWPASAAGRG